MNSFSPIELDRNRYRCKECGDVGHNRRTCPQLADSDPAPVADAPSTDPIAVIADLRETLDALVIETREYVLVRQRAEERIAANDRRAAEIRRQIDTIRSRP